MRYFDTYEEAMAFKQGLPSRMPYDYVSGLYVRMLRCDPCAYCDAPSEVIDHVVPVASGGPNDWANYTGACAACNARKSAKPLLIFLAHENGCWEWRSEAKATPEVPV
jgi:hypothetical protein